MFLNQEQLEQLTDCQQKAAQRRWLAERGWKFEIGRSGRPKVLVAEAERRMLGSTSKKAKELNLKAA